MDINKLKKKTVERSFWDGFSSLIIAWLNPLSINMFEMAIKIANNSTVAKSLGVNNLANMAVTSIVVVPFPTVPKLVHKNPLKVFFFNSMKN